MRQFVESLKRLYGNHKVDREKILQLYIEKKISKDEYEFVVGDALAN